MCVNFNTDSVEAKLMEHEGFQTNLQCVITLEGVTQYIPKESTADTLKKLKTIVAPGSTLLITYVDQRCFADPATLPKSIRMTMGMVARMGEPWISGWTQEEFAVFLKECGYKVESDTTDKDYNTKYLEPVGRKLETEFLSMERFVVAKVV